MLIAVYKQPSLRAHTSGGLERPASLSEDIEALKHIRVARNINQTERTLSLDGVGEKIKNVSLK